MALMRAIDLSIIIPTYNEAVPVQGVPRIRRSLCQLRGYLVGHGRGMTCEIIVVDARSPDGTSTVVRELMNSWPGLRLIDAGPKPARHFTKGRQVALGMLSARGRYALFMDADLATPLHHLQTVMALMARGEPIGIGVRSLRDTHHGVRRLISRAGNQLAQRLLIPGVDDTQCGFKVFRRDVAQRLFAAQRVTGFGFDLELLALAQHFDYRLTVLPIMDWQDVIEGSKLGSRSLLATAVGVLGDIVRIAWGLRMGSYAASRAPAVINP